MFNNMGVWTKLIPVKDFFLDHGEGILFQLHFFFFELVVVFLVFVILVVEIGTTGLVPEPFISACALVVVVVRMLDFYVATGNHRDLFWKWRY